MILHPKLGSSRDFIFWSVVHQICPRYKRFLIKNTQRFWLNRNFCQLTQSKKSTKIGAGSDNKPTGAIGKANVSKEWDPSAQLIQTVDTRGNRQRFQKGENRGVSHPEKLSYQIKRIHQRSLYKTFIRPISMIFKVQIILEMISYLGNSEIVVVIRDNLTPQRLTT